MQMLNSTNNIKIAKHFRLSEFSCPCCNRVMLHPKLLAKLVELRNILERPVYITSGYRCPKYNQKVGGVLNSYHCIGLAADITVKDMELILLLEICENIDFNGIGFYEKKHFLHLDVRPTKKARWREELVVSE
ncbi:MAG: D-Ala-D-Ala carboxypeptidase family metallohydrolase [Candidatus Caldatribacteriota bacterium]|nr:D-Ala-D-Ala carboxypeptidase family metallohydrolase [Candidatus Caldatribacteriota bacterium]